MNVAVDGEITPGRSAVDNSLTVRVRRVARDTQLAQMATLVTDAQHGKAQAQRMADRISGVFVPVVIGAGASFTAAVAILIVACPGAVGLATPTALMVGTGRVARPGILIKGPRCAKYISRTSGPGRIATGFFDGPARWNQPLNI